MKTLLFAGSFFLLKAAVKSRPDCGLLWSILRLVMSGLQSCVQRHFKADGFIFAGDTAAAAVPAFFGEFYLRCVFSHFKKITGAAGYAFSAFFAFFFIKDRRHSFLLYGCVYYCWGKRLLCPAELRSTVGIQAGNKAFVIFWIAFRIIGAPIHGSSRLFALHAGLHVNAH